jgi:hypothetical protein
MVQGLKYILTEQQVFKEASMAMQLELYFLSHLRSFHHQQRWRGYVAPPPVPW